MAPAQQRLSADHAIGSQVHDRLKQQSQLVLLERDVQVGLQADEGRRLARHVRRVDDDLRGLLPLGNRQRNVGFADHILSALLTRIDRRHTDRGRHDELVSSQLEGRAQFLLQQPGYLQCRIGRGHIENHHGKLVAAPAGQHALEYRGRFLETARGLHHQLITGRVAEHVVDELEAGDVDDDDRYALAALRAYVAQCPVQLIHEIAPVGQACEGIVKTRVIECFLQIETLLHLGRQLLVDGAQALARRRQSCARALQGMAQIMSSEGQQPRQEGEQADVRGQLGGRIPAGARDEWTTCR